jgi:hypothetical protein
VVGSEPLVAPRVAELDDRKDPRGHDCNSDTIRLMEWWGGVAWTLFVSAGAYGAWRSWRTDRSLKLLGKKWEFVPDGAHQDMYLLANRMPRTARNIEVTGPMGKMVPWGR